MCAKVRQLLSGSSKKSKSPLDSSLENQVSRDKRLSDRRDEGLADPQASEISHTDNQFAITIFDTNIITN